MTDQEHSQEPRSAGPDAPKARGIGVPIWLVLLLVGSAGLAVLARRTLPANTPAPAATSTQASVPGDVAQAANDASTISGRVIERLDVPKYTYLSLDTGAGSPTWVAVSSAEVSVGQSVEVVDAELMTQFSSTALKRTFERIYFGRLDDGRTKAAPNAELAHALRAGGDPHAGIPGAPALGPGTTPNPHGAPATAPSNVEVGDVAKAEGRTGRRVLETYSQRRELAGQKVRVRGVVVKVIANVMERNFVRVRDGSEDANVRDLLVTTRATPAVGDKVLFEGKVAIDKDFGAGYTYEVLLEDAEIVSDAAGSSATL